MREMEFFLFRPAPRFQLFGIIELLEIHDYKIVPTEFYATFIETQIIGETFFNATYGENLSKLD